HEHGGKPHNGAYVDVAALVAHAGVLGPLVGLREFSHVARPPVNRRRAGAGPRRGSGRGPGSAAGPSAATGRPPRTGRPAPAAPPRPASAWSAGPPGNPAASAARSA